MFYDSTIILLLPAILLSFWASAKVRTTFSKFSQVRNSRNITGAQAARMMLDANGLNSVQIRQVGGSLTDHYNPKDRTLNLSESVCNVSSIGAVAVACHEAGHAVQHANAYAPLTFRNSIVPIVNFASSLTWIFIMIGFGLISSANTNVMGNMLLNIGIIAFLVVVIFHLVTLPVEFNASSRAIEYIETQNVVSGDEVAGCRKVLNAAALTYVAAAATALANLARILIIRGRNR